MCSLLTGLAGNKTSTVRWHYRFRTSGQLHKVNRLCAHSISHTRCFQRVCEQDWFTRGHAAKRAVSLIRKLAQSPFFASSAPVPATGRRLGSPVRRSPLRGALVGDCSVVASAPLTPLAPTMDARFGTPVLMPISRIAHLSSTSIVEEAAVGPSSSPESSTPLRQVGVTLVSFLTGSPASGAESTIVHITQGRHATLQYLEQRSAAADRWRLKARLVHMRQPSRHIASPVGGVGDYNCPWLVGIPTPLEL